MSDALRYAISGRLVSIQVGGRSSASELLGLLETALSDPATQKPARVLVDVNESMSERPHDEIEAIVSRLAARASELDRIAILGSGDLRFGLIRVASSLAQSLGLAVEPFRDRASALAFLELGD